MSLFFMHNTWPTAGVLTMYVIHENIRLGVIKNQPREVLLFVSYPTLVDRTNSNMDTT